MLAYNMYTYVYLHIHKLNAKNMWTKSHSIVNKEVTKEQMWKRFANVNNWHVWNKGIEFAKMEGKFEKDNSILLKPQGDRLLIYGSAR